MDDLIAFLRARLDEDEAAAQEAKNDLSGRWAYVQTQGGRGKVTDDLGYSVSETDDIDSQPWVAQPHIARWDPARVLAEVEAKRKLINWLAEWDDRMSNDNYWPWDSSDAWGLLVQPYAEHPNCRTEWRP